MIKLFLFIPLVIFLASCVEMRDYTGVRDGFFGLDFKKGFGQGEDRKDYYLIQGEIAIVRGDSKNEIITKLGYPKEIVVTLERYECWIYQEKKIKLFFDGDYLNGWQAF